MARSNLLSIRLAPVLTIFLAGTASAANPLCSVPVSSADVPTASDCLFILKVAVGLEACEPCVCATSGHETIRSTDALLCLRASVGQAVALVCPSCPGDTTTTTTTTTTSTVPASAGVCPGVVQWTTEAAYGPACSDNGDCSVGSCDQPSGRCHTATDLDLGWTGLGHDGELGAGGVLRVRVECDAEGPVCGQCSIAGIDPSPGNCRCANDPRRRCDQPFAADPNDCPSCLGGALAGSACSDDGDCEAGPCATRCTKTPTAACASNADCPSDTCAATTSCSNEKNCSADADCVGSCAAAAACDCYDGAPLPLSVGGTPICMLRRFASDVAGSVDVDSGASSVTMNLLTVTYFGISTRGACPVCGGTCSNDAAVTCSYDSDCSGGTCQIDAVAGDGVRGGVCLGGAASGLPCDVEVTNPSLPASVFPHGSGGYSLDCLPSDVMNISGQGIRLSSIEATGTTELASNLSCAGSPAGRTCPCLACSGDSTVACSSDSECASQRGSCSLATAFRCDSDPECASVNAGSCVTIGPFKRCSGLLSRVCSADADCQNVSVGTCKPSTCSSNGAGYAPSPNGCDGGLCTDLGNGDGICTNGPDDRFCNGIVRANGDGAIACTSDEDCSFGEVWIDGGQCGLTKRRPCFPSPIVAGGVADPSAPVTATAFCLPPIHPAANALFGLVGPGRLHRQSTRKVFCASDPAAEYQPGIGGCPP